MIDYYAVLQVHPDAEQEVIDAAYRQLMRKYHPDVAGDDAARAQLLHERAKLINQAYAVLGDRDERWWYDKHRLSSSSAAGRAEPDTEQQYTVEVPPPSDSSEPAAAVSIVVDEGSQGWAPLRALAAGYYFLPGPYEWEPGHRGDVLAALLVLPLGVATWSVATGRLSASLGGLPVAVLAGCAGLLVLPLLVGHQLPRMFLAAAPSLLQFSGALDAPLRSAHVPTVAAAGGVALVSLLLSARLYVFAVLPTVGLCWALSHFV